MIGEIPERMPKRGKFPVEHGQHTVLCRMQHHIVEPIVAMNNAGRIIVRNIVRQPVHQLVHLADAL